ncbi:MAG: hypothetical protein EHM79_19695 [Geobacter sp.]|nr:MAG: hypothetical protein EHM79_19695 [Geobacter sp.]
MKAHKETFLSFVQKHANSKLVIASHSNVDLDALSSAYAVKSVFPKAILAFPEKMDSPAQSFCEHMDIEYKAIEKLKPADYDGLVVVDCSTYVLLKEAKAWKGKVLLIIDHHHKSETAIEGKENIRDEDAKSTAEIVSTLLPSFTPDVAFALSVAIISDTARFKSGKPSTFVELARMLEISGKDYREALEFAEPELELDKKASVLEAFKLMHISIRSGYTIATVEVPAHESLISSSISEFADVAFAANWRGEAKETRVSSRARKCVPVMLNEVMAQVASEYRGSGGGHPKAAGCSAKEKPAKVLERCVEVLAEKLEAFHSSEK